MARPFLLDELKRRVVLCDGAMGTQLFAADLAPGACGERWNLTKPDAIAAIHRAYLDAGCDCVTTNTFGGSSVTLVRHGLDDDTIAINRAGAEVARRAAGRDAWVLGNLGPTGAFLEPLGDLSRQQAVDVFTEQATALRDGGADAILIETMTDPNELSAAIEAVRAVSDMPVIATSAFDRGDGQTYRTMMGATASDALRAARDAGADVVGANCGTDMTLDDYRRLVAQLLDAAAGAPVIVQPNAGAPRMEGDTQVYPATPQDMRDLAAALMDAGIAMIGGCCGTTPAHMAAMAQAVNRKDGAS